MGYFSHIYAADLPSRAVAVYMYLADRADRYGRCFPAISTIGRELKLSRSTVKRAIADLESGGFLQRQQRWRESGGKSSNLYQIRR